MKLFPKYLINSLLAAAASCCSVFCVTTGFDIPVNVGLVILWALLSALFFNACFVWKKALWLLIPLTACVFLLATVTDLFAPVSPTLLEIIKSILTKFSSAYPNFSFAIPASQDISLTLSQTLVFSIIAIILSIWMAWGVGYRSCLISVAGTLPFLLICVIINNTPPNALPLTILLIVWVTVLLSKERQGEPPAMDALRVCLVLLAVIVVIGSVGVFYPKDDTKDQELPQFVQDFVDMLPEPLQSMLERNGEKKPTEQLGADTSTVLDLTQQGIRERKDTLMMQVSTTKVGPIYLRAAAKDIYTGSSWESSDMASSADSVYAHTSLGTAFGTSNQAAVQITNHKETANVVFMPYGYISCTSAEDIVSDLRVNINESSYVIYYWPDTFSLDLTTDLGYVRESYDKYVEETCLSMPEETRQTLYDLALSYGYDPEMSVPETVAWVASFIRRSGTYRLDVSRQPINHDFALYFLTESNQGYCVHFATAAAVMYRALGIPSRYASGYRVTVPSSGIVVDVLDRDAHAWAEVYISGLGWIPVETTPGFGETSVLPQVQQPTPPDPSPSPEPAEPSPSPMSASPSPSEMPAAPSPATDGHQNIMPEQQEPGASGSLLSGRSPIYTLISCCGVLILLLLIIVIRRIVISAMRRKAFRHEDPNQAVLNMWQYAECLASWKISIPKDLEALALKAKFSHHRITDTELNDFLDSVYLLHDSVKTGARGLKRIKFSWIKVLRLPKRKS